MWNDSFMCNAIRLKVAVKYLSLNLFLTGLLNIVKGYQHIKSLHMLGYERFGRFSDGVWKFEAKVGWVTSFSEKKIYFLPPWSRVLIMTSPLMLSEVRNT